jgi:uncharacterized NAD(P)/FAD-binding protein YdhS
MTDLTVGIIGGGPWGMAVLDRLVTLAHENLARPIRIVLFDPAPFGPGVHDPDQPGHLLLNTVTNQVDSFSARHFGEVPLPGALPFLDWMRQSDGNVSTSGFLPRRTFGAYMRFVFITLKENLPDNADLLALNLAVTAVEPRHDARYRLTDSDGGWHDVDHVFICTGHGQRGVPVTDCRDGALSPYPCDALHSAIAPRSIVGVQGMGLTAVDVVATLTEGRGGRFAEQHDGSLRYYSSGTEPVIYCFSRSGTPFSCRPSETLDLSGRYTPIFCSAEALPQDRALDFEADVLPLLCAEMWAAFAMRHAALRDGPEAWDGLRARFAGVVPESAEQLAREMAGTECETFDPRGLLLASPQRTGLNARDAADRVMAHLHRDVTEATKGEEASPYKHAIEMLRVNRNFIRAAVNYGRLTPQSRQLFFNRVAPAIAQLIVGPPLSRGREWLALARAGVLRFELSRAPEVQRDSWYGHWTARSGGHMALFDSLVCARVGHGPETDPLLTTMVAQGLCSRISLPGLSYLSVDADARPLDSTGLPLEGVSLLGVPSEGSTYFNHYLPSPRSRAHVFEQINRALTALTERADSRQCSAA